MIYYFDIDGTICATPGGEYTQSSPIEWRIRVVNELFDKGHKIILWTGRGTGTGINWEDVTRKQLEQWRVKYHELKFGKPVYDLFVDDKNFNSEMFFKP